MQCMYTNSIDYQIKFNTNELLKLQIEHQRMQNKILTVLLEKQVAINHPIIKYNIMKIQYDHLLDSLSHTDPPDGLYS